jgi:hypothetical protein
MISHNGHIVTQNGTTHNGYVAPSTPTRKRRNAYHAPANMQEMQQNIAAVTLNHVRQGKAADFRNIAITYPMAFDLIHMALGKTERNQLGITCNEATLRRSLVKRERERLAEVNK